MRLTFPEVAKADQQSLPFTPDQQAAIRAKARQIQEHLQMVPFFFDNEGLTREMARSVLNVSESDMAALGALLGVDTESAARIEQRHGDIRRANLRVHELEKLLGQAQPIEAIQPALQTLTRQVYAWWTLEGFGHVSDMSFGEYAAKVTFSCGFMGCKPKLIVPEGSTRKERLALWLAELQARGFVLMDDDGDKGVKDCPESRNALRALFAQRLPGARISQFVSHETRHRGSVLRSVEVYVYDLAAIRELPVPEANADDID